MKKYSRSQRVIDVRQGYLARNKRQGTQLSRSVVKEELRERWFEDKIDANKLNAEVDSRHKVVIHLPSVMNFTTNLEITITHLMAIRRLVRTGAIPPGSLKLRLVEFENLKSISTTAALVLTAELAKWEDASSRKLEPHVERWDENIYQQFGELGFFDLFKNTPEKSISENYQVNRHLVKYIKGKFREHSKPRLLQKRLDDIVGNDIDMWEFLHTGLVEAIINVTHHAYPIEKGYIDRDKNWYLSGSYDVVTRQLKIVFYDQGVTIPRSLPASKWGERILEFVRSKLDVVGAKSLATGVNDSMLVSAAMQMSRTRTGQSDRGKGLQDILEFVKQRKQGYLAVVSGRGYFKLEVDDRGEKNTTEAMKEPLLGTLIVWSVTLESAD